MRLLTLKTILAATDLEEGSMAALRTAGRLAELTGADLHLLHIQSHPEQVDREELIEQYRRATAGAVDPKSGRVRTGTPAELVVQQARRLKADAVILGPHRHSSASIGEMGSTAAQVVRTSPCPCLVAATELRLPLKRVLAPIEGSSFSRSTLAVALTWASALRPRGEQAALTAMHVLSGQAEDPVADDVRREVDEARSSAGDAAFVDIRERIGPGADIAGEILVEAAAESVDLLVMGTRGADIPPAQMGSVSAAVARETPIPLLLVPPDYAFD